MKGKGKDFAGGFSSILDGMAAASTQTPAQSAAAGSTAKRSAGRPRLVRAEEETRATFILPVRLLRELQAIAFEETGRRGEKVLYKDILAEALQNYVDDYRNKSNK